MLRIVLEGTSGRVGSLEVANVGGGALCDYAAVVYDGQDRPISMAMVERYARWSAPVHDLMLRALAIALCDSETTPAWERIRFARPAPSELLALLWLQPPLSQSRQLARWSLPIRRSGSMTERLEEGPPTAIGLPVIDARESAWAVLARVWCHRLTGSCAMPPRPPPVHVPLRHHNGRAYVSGEDLPAHIRPAILRRFQGSTQPVVSGVMEPWYPWDIETFLGYPP